MFKASLPLLRNLRNPHLRPRHWDVIRTAMGARFQEAAVSLRGLLSMQVEEHAGIVAEQAELASREQAMEAAINDVAEVWSTKDYPLLSHNRCASVNTFTIFVCLHFLFYSLMPFIYLDRYTYVCSYISVFLCFCVFMRVILERTIAKAWHSRPEHV